MNKGEEEEKKVLKKKRPTAEKRLKQDIKKRSLNRMYKTKCKTLLKKFNLIGKNEKVTVIQTFIKDIYSAFDKASLKGVLSKSKAGRVKSKIMKREKELLLNK